MNEEFYAVVLDWLRTSGGHPEATRVNSVTTYSSDSAGDTEHGFYDTFEVWVGFERGDEQSSSIFVAGSELDSLWKHVVTAGWETTS